jgi:alcohol dehydrogenase class IV
MTFEFATAGRIVFGCRSSHQLPALARSLGSSALLILGGSGRRGEAIVAQLDVECVRAAVFHVGEEPTTQMVSQATELARTRKCDVVIAVGGGSVIDTGKAVAALLANPGDLMDYLEVVGAGKPLSRPGVPCIAVPTTAGTGAEVTRNSVLGVPEPRVKVSLRSPYLLPRMALIDPELTRSLPPEVTAYGGLDALTQLIEPLVCNAPNPLTDGLCREGLKRAARSLRVVFHDGTDLAAREDMCVAALFSGMALANAKLGAVHGFAGVLGGTTGHAHGATCARLLPFVMEANIRALQAEGRHNGPRERYDEIARILTGDPAARAVDGVEWVRAVCEELKIPPLSHAGLTREDLDSIIPAARRASSMKGNPVELPDRVLLEILERAM